jgi:hypothetical protein
VQRLLGHHPRHVILCVAELLAAPALEWPFSPGSHTIAARCAVFAVPVTLALDQIVTLVLRGLSKAGTARQAIQGHARVALVTRTNRIQASPVVIRVHLERYLHHNPLRRHNVNADLGLLERVLARTVRETPIKISLEILPAHRVVLGVPVH